MALISAHRIKNSLRHSFNKNQITHLFYRYRPFSEISLKELLYSEIYFASPEECNDPFDSKSFYLFYQDREKWKRLISFSLEGFKVKIPETFIERLVNHIVIQGPFSFDVALQFEFLNNFPVSENEEELIKLITYALGRTWDVYSPEIRYFVSFSRTNDEPLMWSHYASKHEGFCLIFRALEGRLKQDYHFRKRSIGRSGTKGIAPQMSIDLPEDFEFVDIKYNAKVDHLDAFTHMPKFVFGEVDKKKGKQLEKLRESFFTQKGINWRYENESRLVLSPPPSWLFGEKVQLTRQERLFHYEPSQLVGIIYGARMAPSDKERIREILKERENRDRYVGEYKRIEFRFVEFEAKLSGHQRKLEIEPCSLFVAGQPIKAGDNNFERLYKEWKEGVGWVREGNKSSRINVK